jgi:hypothetical protein
LAIPRSLDKEQQDEDRRQDEQSQHAIKRKVEEVKRSPVALRHARVCVPLVGLDRGGGIRAAKIAKFD